MSQFLPLKGIWNEHLAVAEKLSKLQGKKPNKQVCSLITVYTWLETGDEIIDLKEDIMAVFLFFL